MSNMSETSLDLCGIAKGCPPERESENDYTQHVSISDTRRTPTSLALNCGTTRAERDMAERVSH
jgi:hypothetical protein